MPSYSTRDLPSTIDSDSRFSLSFSKKKFHFERPLHRYGVAVSQAHQLGLDAFRKGKHLPPLALIGSVSV
jgi:hypothetical protein